MKRSKAYRAAAEARDANQLYSINEAVELGKTFGNEESSAFINGLLDRVAIALDKA